MLFSNSASFCKFYIAILARVIICRGYCPYMPASAYESVKSFCLRVYKVVCLYIIFEREFS